MAFSAHLAGPTTQSLSTVNILDKNSGVPLSNCFWTGHISAAIAMFNAKRIYAKSTSSAFTPFKLCGVNMLIHFAKFSFSFLSVSRSPRACFTRLFVVFCFHSNSVEIFRSRRSAFCLRSTRASSNVSRRDETCSEQA